MKDQLKQVLQTPNDEKIRIIQEIVPGNQISLLHLIAGPDEDLYRKLGLDPRLDYGKSAIGIVSVTPAEVAIIAGDIASKASNVELGFIDRFSGTLIITGRISEVEEAFREIVEYTRDTLGFSICPITRT